MSDIAAIQGIDSELDGFWGGKDSSGPMLGIILATPPQWVWLTKGGAWGWLLLETLLFYGV